MFARFSSVFLVAICTVPVLVAASAVPRTEPTTNQCNTGSNQCCTDLHDARDSVSSSVIGGILGVDIEDIASGLLGSGCSSILAGQSCSQDPVCCTGNAWNGLINIGCTPVNVNL